MKALLQRVRSASVTIDGQRTASIDQGLLVFVGVMRGDTAEAASWLARKTAALRIFDDDDGRMNRSVVDVNGGVLVVSQFTLAATVSRGSRPSYSDAEDPTLAEKIYNAFVEELDQYVSRVATGSFGAMMEVSLVNDGPVTILLDRD